jgi:RNA polymerase sigma-70 factor (ECF subfamily)
MNVCESTRSQTHQLSRLTVMEHINPVARRTQVFEQHRARLHGIAYRMLGSRADADDVVQEAWLRWNRAATDDIRSPEAWLVTAATRLSIDRLRQMRTEREAYVGPWLPEPISLDTAPPADRAVELASDLSVAFLAVLERLAPEERAAFLLHDLFDSGYDDIARILGKSEAACRQIVSRARKRVREDQPRVEVSGEARQRLLHGLVEAVQAQDPVSLMNLLSADATWTSDGGGKAKAARKIIRGAEHVARFATGVFHRHLDRMEFRDVVVNGEAGIAALFDGHLISVISILTDGQRILGVYSILNPDKLRGFELAH